MNITRHSEVFKAAASRVVSGQSTREEEATALGVKHSTFSVWMSRSKFTSRVNPDGTKKLAGAALGWAMVDSPKARAIAAATERVLSGELRVVDVVSLYPDLADDPGRNRATIAARVRRARVAQGIDVGVWRPTPKQA